LWFRKIARLSDCIYLACHHTTRIHQEWSQRLKPARLPHCRGLGAGAAAVWSGTSPPNCSHRAPCPLASSWNTGIPVRGERCVHFKSLNHTDTFIHSESNLFNCSQKHVMTARWSNCLCMYEHVHRAYTVRRLGVWTLHPLGYLLGLEPRWDPCVLLGGAARVIVGDGVSLEVWHQLRHHLFQLARHRAHGVLLSHTLAVNTDLPVETKTAWSLLIYNTRQSWSHVKYFRRRVLPVLQVLRWKPRHVNPTSDLHRPLVSRCLWRRTKKIYKEFRVFLNPQLSQIKKNIRLTSLCQLLKQTQTAGL